MSRREVTFEIVSECMQTGLISGYKGEGLKEFDIIYIFVMTLAAINEGKFMNNFPNPVVEYVASKIASGVCVYFANYADDFHVGDIEDAIFDFLNNIFD